MPSRLSITAITAITASCHAFLSRGRIRPPPVAVPQLPGGLTNLRKALSRAMACYDSQQQPEGID